MHFFSSLWVGRVAVFLLLSALPGESVSAEKVAPSLGVGTTFMAGPARQRMAMLERLGLGELRDALSWKDAQDGVEEFGFAGVSARQMAQLDQRGLLGSLILMPNVASPLGGVTAQTEQDIAAYGVYARAVADRFPRVLIEVANEFNGNSFVTGPAAATDTLARAQLHARLLESINRAGVPAERVLGAAAHSIAAGYIWALLDAGAAHWMSAVTIHPYTSQPEAYVRQLEVLRRHPQMNSLAVDVTEFGTTHGGQAADFFWRSYCSMALADVRRAQWYPLEQRGDGYAALLDRTHSVTPLGRAFLFARNQLEGLPVKVIAPDPFTFGCQFGEFFAVVWGARRSVTLNAEHLEMRHADMVRRSSTAELDQERVLLVEATEGKGGLNWREDIVFGSTNLLADSFYQFTYPDSARPVSVKRGGFSGLIRDAAGERDLITCPGQERVNAPWFPYLCDPTVRRAVMHDRGFTLGGSNQVSSELIWRHAIMGVGSMRMVVEVDLAKVSQDGVRLRVEANGKILEQRQVEGQQTLTFGPYELDVGDQLDLVVAPGANPVGDTGRLRVALYKQEAP